MDLKGSFFVDNATSISTIVRRQALMLLGRATKRELSEKMRGGMVPDLKWFKIYLSRVQFSYASRRHDISE